MSDIEGFSDPEFEDGATLYDKYRRLQKRLQRVEALEKEWRDGDQYDQDAAAYLRDALNGIEEPS